MAADRDTVPSVNLPPNIPRGTDPATFREEVEKMIDVRMNQYDAARRAQEAEVKNTTFKNKVRTYGISATIGAVAGAAGMWGFQRLRGRKSSM